MNGFVRRNFELRSDLSIWLVHFTEGPKDHAAETLKTILNEGCLRSWETMPVVCFTEAPLREFHALFQHAFSRYRRPLFAPYGIAVRKRWLFDLGGRPVIYGPENEKALLPAEMQYRHVDYIPLTYDFMWMREWRIQTDELLLDPKETLVVVPDEDAAWGIVYESGEELEYDGPDEYSREYWSWRDWHSFALDQLDGNPANSDKVISMALTKQELNPRDED